MRLATLLLLLAAALVGIAAGVGAFTFAYARGASYLSDDPAACANCHVMGEQHAGWSRSSHHDVAVCNDCHTPADFFGKYFVKAKNGWHHSRAFTLGGFHEPITITAANLEVTEGRCRSCHAEVVEAIDVPEPVSCVRCHSSTGHL